MKLSAWLSIGLMLLPLVAHGAVYKRVDANGHVTYTDKPVSAEETQRQQKGGVKSETKSLISSENAADPKKAASSIIGLAASVDAGAQFCKSQVSPEIAGKVALAREAWRNKHGALVEKARLIMKDQLSDSQLALLMRTIDNEANRVIAQLSLASLVEKQQACTQMPPRYVAPEMDISANQALVNTITNYRFQH